MEFRSAIAALAIALASSGCASTPALQTVNLDAIRADQTLVLGRIRVVWLGRDVTGRSWIKASDGGDYPLPWSGEVAWLRPRPASELRIMISQLKFNRDSLLAIPATAQRPIVYFGDVVINLVAENHQFRGYHALPSFLDLHIEDNAGTVMPAFVAESPALAGRQYFDVMAKALKTAPPPRAPLPGDPDD